MSWRNFNEQEDYAERTANKVEKERQKKVISIFDLYSPSGELILSNVTTMQMHRQFIRVHFTPEYLKSKRYRRSLRGKLLHDLGYKFIKKN